MQHLYDYKYKDEKATVEGLLEVIDYPDELRNKSGILAQDYVEYVRKHKKQAGQLQKFIQEYELTTQEGLALMSLAEALMRIPDSMTADSLIKDRISTADWESHILSAEDILVKLSSIGLATSKTVVNSMVKRLGMPVIRNATFQAMKILGGLFVLGESIEEAYKRGKKRMDEGYLYSFDMLGEGARTFEDAERYFESYIHAVEVVGNNNKNKDAGPLATNGVSVKLSALHPKFHFANREECVPELQEKLTFLARKASENGIVLTMDAEEADRLTTSLEVFEHVMKDKQLAGWNGLGLAVQAYQKRAYPLLQHLVEQAEEAKRLLRVRLVKGAYWDTEVKHSQVFGHSDYPVFTRKANTDLSFLTCSQYMLNNRDRLVPFLATHNAHTIAAVMQFAGQNKKGFGFQCLHGMGQLLYRRVQDEGVPISIYGPVGKHADLLPYLVRRLLENGANSSFVNQIYDEQIDISTLTTDPVLAAQDHQEKRHTLIPLPKDIYQPDRANSRGIDVDDEVPVSVLYKKMEKTFKKMPKPPKLATSKDVDAAFKKAGKAFISWDNTPASERAAILNKAGDLMEEHMEHLMAICIKEAGKNIPDSIAEVREAVEFAHYYAARGVEDFSDFKELQGPTGELNLYRMRGRGVFVCISPWNFPLAIFSGQVLAALMAGNTVICKPAEQTPIIAAEAVRLMHKAGVPKDALILLNGDGKIGGELVNHPDAAGVTFTGSTEVAKLINISLAKKDGPITPLIAETGGQNTMIVDSTALPEQVVDDVILSGFGSAGQRCSALRVLCVQEDVADTMLTMLERAIKHFTVGDPLYLKHDIGPVIDQEAYDRLDKHYKKLEKDGHVLIRCPNVEDKKSPYYFAPILAEIPSLDYLETENFGPIIHVYRYKNKDIDKVVDKINALGYGLTFGVHSRILSKADKLANQIRVGNVYVNRSMTGAVVGVQPFGGQGLSGTGPKAGGHNYLKRFATEQAVSIDTTATGGNTTLVNLREV